MTPALLALLTVAAAAAPLDAPIAARAADGWVVRDQVVRETKPFPLAAVVYGRKDGTGGSALEVYGLLKGRAYLLSMHPGSAEKLDLDSGPVGRGLPDLLGDGSRVVAYRSTIPTLDATTLHILAVRGLKATAAGRFAEGKFASIEGKIVVVARELPLGRNLAVDCEDFGSLSHNAFKTTLHAPRGGRFVDVSAQYPGFYDAEIARKTGILTRMKGELPKNSGEYLGLALSLYFDYAARGQARVAWDRQSELYPPYVTMPGRARTCLNVIKTDLRKRLAIPADWP